LQYRMYIHACSNSVTGGVIPYCGMKKAKVERENWWSL